MPKDKKIKDAVRARMAVTGETYMQARQHVVAVVKPEPIAARIGRLLEAHPDLGYFGYLCRGDDREKFAEARPWLTSVGAREVETCLEYLALVGKNQTARRGVGSYHLKHRVESWLIQSGRGGYVSNGAFIVAALLADVPLRRDAGTPNCVVGVKLKDVETLSPYMG